jgi:hypothetical protein
MLKQTRTVMVLATTLGLLLASCKKNKDGNKDADDHKQDIPVARQLKVYFDETTVDFARYDSGFIVLQKEGNSTQYLKRFVKDNNALKIDIDGLAEGKYHTIMHLNVRLKNDNKAIWRQYRYEKDVQLVQSGVVIKGPVNELKKDWKIYCVMSNNTRSFHITVPLDCTDPYFEVYAKNAEWDHLYLERNAMKRNNTGNPTRVGAMHFECAEGCFDSNGNLADGETFKDWSEMISTKQWDAGEFFIQLLHQNTGEDVTILYSYDIPDLQ